MSCIVKECHAVARLQTQFSYHQFPKEPALLEKWLQALKIEGVWEWSRQKKVCSKHFVNTDFIFVGSRKFLKRGAVPSLLYKSTSLTNKDKSLTAFNLGQKPSDSSRSEIEVVPSTSFNSSVSGGAKADELSTSNSGNSAKSKSTPKKLKVLKRKKSIPKSKLRSSPKSSKKRMHISITSSDASGTSTDSSKKRRRVKMIREMHSYCLPKNISRSSPESSLTKMHISLTSSNASGTTTDSSTKRRRVNVIREMHSYCASPSSHKRSSETLKHKQAIYRKKLYNSRLKNRKLKAKVANLKTVISSLKKEQLVSENALEHVQKSYEAVPALLMARYLKNVQNQTATHETYPSPLREFAATLHFYSNKAYEHVRKQFSLALPHQNTLRKWFANLDCSPGFITPALNVLKLKSDEAKNCGRELICSLMLDEMSIRKKIEFDGKKMWGYENVGVPTENDELYPASEALVILVVATQGYWKLPIAYFLIKSLSGKEKANVVTESLTRLHSAGVTVTSITCDGPSAHFTMLKELGCNFDNVFSMKTFFTHPSDQSSNVFAVLDACHMLKLARNALASLVDIKDQDGRLVSWRYIKKLHNMQEEEGLLVGNKLKKAHIEWHKQKMKVYLAAQTFSRSTADALKFLSQEMHLQEFNGCEGTIDFILTIDGLFDILNSRSPFARGLKGPLRESNENIWRPFLTNAIQYLLRCTDVAGRPLWMTPRKTPFIGFAITALSVCGIFDEFVKGKKMAYLLTHKFSQDHLETFFCSVRSRNGWNNNPSALQFMRSFRKLLLHARISGESGNCRVLDTTTVLHVPSTSNKSVTRIDTIDIGICRKFGIDAAESITEEDVDLPLHHIPLSEVVTNVVAYVAGFVVKMMCNRSHCVECILECFKSRNDLKNMGAFKLTFLKDRGGLVLPSEGVIEICIMAEKTIRKILTVTNNKIPSEEAFFSTLTLAISQKFYGQMDRLFPNLRDHISEEAANEESHGIKLIKNIASFYCRIRIHNIAKKYTAEIQGPNIRRELNKLILFNHQ